MKTFAGMMTAMLVLGAVTVSAAEPQRQIEGQRDIQRYQAAAMGDVQQMKMPALVDWQALDSDALAVWTANDKAWLVHTQGACAGLTTSENVALTSRDGMVKVGTDAVEVGSTKCRIESIQPVDYTKIAARPHHAMHHAKRMEEHKATT